MQFESGLWLKLAKFVVISNPEEQKRHLRERNEEDLEVKRWRNKP